jgi:hypothetical protein
LTAQAGEENASLLLETLVLSKKTNPTTFSGLPGLMSRRKLILQRKGIIMITSKLKILTGIVFTVSLLGSLTMAEAGVRQRQVRQQNRIYQGVNSGALTRGEFRRLEREQYHIQRDKQRSWSDGEVTRRERARLNRELNHASRDIYREKHDKQVRK